MVATEEHDMTTIVSSRVFNQDISAAKRAADVGPVIITDRGAPAYVLMSHEAYATLVGGGRSILDLLDQPDAPDFEFDPPKLSGLSGDIDLT
jgi:prevent-host-death family protein